MNKIISDFLKEIDKRNSHEPEFMQAVREVSEDLIPLNVKNESIGPHVAPVEFCKKYNLSASSVSFTTSAPKITSL